MPKSCRILAAITAVLLLTACGSGAALPEETAVYPTVQSGQVLLPDWEHIPQNEVLADGEEPDGDKTDGKEDGKQTESKGDNKPDTKPDDKQQNQNGGKTENTGNAGNTGSTGNTGNTGRNDSTVKQPEVTTPTTPTQPTNPTTPTEPEPTPTPDPEPEPEPEPTPTPTPEPEPEPDNSGDDTTGYGTLSVINVNTPVTGDTYDILCRVVQNEVGNTTEWESTKAMAVASYSYIKYYNDYLGSAPTLRLSSMEPGDRVKACVKEVLGEAVYYNGRYANCTYFSISCGVTTTAQSVWGTTQYPYLVSVDSSIDVGYTSGWSNYQQTKTFTAEEVASRMNSYLGTSLDAANDDPATWLEIQSRTDGLYVGTVRVGNTTTTGRKIREAILGLRSHAFDIGYDESSRTFTFTTYGYGHGVGMSQTGSNLYAKQGWTYVQILNHYYPGTTVA